MMTNLQFFSATSKFFKGRQLSICHSVFSNRSKTLYFRPTGRLIKKNACISIFVISIKQQFAIYTNNNDIIKNKKYKFNTLRHTKVKTLLIYSGNEKGIL